MLKHIRGYRLDLNWLWLIAGGLSVVSSSPARAQSNIVPDNTLGNESSIVNTEVEAALELITGGAQRGQNLFHSFQEFNVTEGRGAYFISNDANLVNIFSRVTGNNISEIFGTLGTSGASQPNLFLINPNGIIFGENSSLDVGASFTATTANSIQFGDRGFFSATNPETLPLLTVQPSAFFFNQIDSGNIQHNSIATAGTDPTGTIPLLGLRVPDGESISLLGGDLNINGGLFALDGKIELGSLAGMGILPLEDLDTGSISFPESVDRGEITINGGTLDTGGSIGGTISIYAENLAILQGGSIGTGVFPGVGSSDNQTGDITVNVTDTLNLDGFGNDGLPSGIGNIIQPGGIGNAGNINILAQSFSLTGGAQILAGTFGLGNGGDINIEANTLALSDSILIEEFDFIFLTRIFSGVAQGGVGNAGDINIVAQDISLESGAQISSGIFFGEGDGGKIDIEANTLFLDGVVGDAISGIFSSVEEIGLGNGGNITLNLDSLAITNGAEISSSILGQGNGGAIDIEAQTIFSSGIGSNDAVSGVFSLVGNNGRGRGGEITITTNDFLLDDGAQINTASFGLGDGGNLDIQANDLILINGGAVNASTTNEGQAGTINIIASESINLVGLNSGILTDTSGENLEPGNLNNAGDAGNTQIISNSLNIENGAKISATTSTSGNGGNITIVSQDNLLVEDNSSIAVSSTGNGVGGNINLETANLSLDNNSLVTAQTFSADGGNINLQVRDLLTLDNQSNITATAGTAEAGGNGGNINIDTEFIIAFPNGSNDITANAFAGMGGNIKISAESLFNIESRLSTPPNDTNDIDASSQFGLDGNISINTPDVDPARGLENLPNNIVDASRLIARNCLSSGDEKLNKFAIVGRGGLPNNPDRFLSGDATLSADWVVLPDEIKQSSTPIDNLRVSKHPIIEAQGWKQKSDGTIVLYSPSPTTNVSSLFLNTASCHSL